MLKRPELDLLAARGVKFSDPSEVIEIFEKRMADFCGAPYAVAVDCATHALELSLRYLQVKGEVQVPRRTYPSVPMTLLQLGCRLRWRDLNWQGIYRLEPTPVWDCSLRLSPGMYQPGQWMCLSFQQKKRLGIGRGGMILLDEARAYHWLKRACHDGRTPGVRWHEDQIQMMGWHYYMTPEDAARGLLLFGDLPGDFSDLGGSERYPDLLQFDFFRQQEAQLDAP